ncbi:hypothetical protein DLM75_00225 [Leptospira stimsonii]|uniref:Uncharacterized protein n=1 Tax=Leptospira stimsonii TaxID=2202203 RepID=A0A396ZF34_9LEPT|nr:hypothetical protein DLM75_00225 [Leptospira stimsonii]
MGLSFYENSSFLRQDLLKSELTIAVSFAESKRERDRKIPIKNGSQDSKTPRFFDPLVIVISPSFVRMVRSSEKSQRYVRIPAQTRSDQILLSILEERIFSSQNLR